ncbi:hypothetical protein HMPREF9622_01950 [Cutibacterium modestum HL037PA3]|nr:hypothetical protein HMPREF9621_02810 [Cutibacterium modestum HL037PA2]EFT14983.1 hypothetical protein HMPREF9622_01950 [Cutibacterium modestum HL037PA3]
MTPRRVGSGEWYGSVSTGYASDLSFIDMLLCRFDYMRQVVSWSIFKLGL